MLSMIHLRSCSEIRCIPVVKLVIRSSVYELVGRGGQMYVVSGDNYGIERVCLHLHVCWSVRGHE